MGVVLCNSLAVKVQGSSWTGCLNWDTLYSLKTLYLYTLYDVDLADSADYEMKCYQYNEILIIDSNFLHDYKVYREDAQVPQRLLDPLGIIRSTKSTWTTRSDRSARPTNGL